MHPENRGARPLPSHIWRQIGCLWCVILMSFTLALLYTPIRMIWTIHEHVYTFKHLCATTFTLMLNRENLNHLTPTKEPATTLCSIFLPVLVKAIPCIGKDLGMCTIEYASLMVELWQDGYTSKTRESRLFEGNQAERVVCLGVNHYLVVLYFPASACQSHSMYR